MNWLVIALICLAAYAVVALYIRDHHIWEDHITFYGPFLALKTERVGFFDKARKYSGFLRIYGSAGVVMVVVISALMALMLIVSVRMTLLIQPEPTGIYEPQNLLLLPGINEFVPFTFAVWFAFVLTLVIHEFGHAMLCRVEDIKVKSMGILFAVIPIGAFVEPDEEDVENTKGMPKIRMLGAGITNNLVVGFACFAVMALLLGTAVPTDQPVIYGVYKDYPADIAGIPHDSVVLSLDGVPVSSREEVADLLKERQPGDGVSLLLDNQGKKSPYNVTLGEWPEGLGEHENGFMGITYFDAQSADRLLDGFFSPIGFFMMITVPFDQSMGGKYLKVLAFDTPDTDLYETPFPYFWGLIHVLFWSAWININVGIFNALPMVPLDGGYIFEEGAKRFLGRWGKEHLARYLVSAVSWLILFMIISMIALPYLLHL